MRDAAGGTQLRNPEESMTRRNAAGDLWERAWEWPVRAFFGGVLAALAVAATFAGGFWFASLIGVAGFAAAREWHRMVSGSHYALETFFTSAAIVVGLLAVLETHDPALPVAILFAGALLAGMTSALRGVAATWSGSGALYIGTSALCLVALRSDAPYGAWVVVGLLLTIWSADTGAFVTGRLLGGPKFVPLLSPNKTWTGIVGGMALPALVFSAYVAILGGSAWRAGILGAVLAITGHSGDLFESWVKRRVGFKNSGSLIPGHGGVLDRMDSTLFVAPVAAVLVFVFGLDPLFGARP
ncbi:MAG: phosphatidate cytidylyltransferase [Rhizomicrobium sp.]|jgi:phosphatidate cytidylyltransferase